MAVYDSEQREGIVSIGSPPKEFCPAPPRGFSVEMQIVDAYDKGFTVACHVDGILCLTKVDAEACFSKRLQELWQKWEAQKAKL